MAWLLSCVRKGEVFIKSLYFKAFFVNPSKLLIFFLDALVWLSKHGCFWHLMCSSFLLITANLIFFFTIKCISHLEFKSLWQKSELFTSTSISPPLLYFLLSTLCNKQLLTNTLTVLWMNVCLCFPMVLFAVIPELWWCLISTPAVHI